MHQRFKDWRPAVVDRRGVGARVGDLPGSGMAQPYRLDGGRLVDDGLPVEVLNLSPVPVGGGAWCLVAPLDGSMVVIQQFIYS